MTTATRFRFDLLICAALTLAFLGAAPMPRADEPGPAALSPPAPDAPDQERFEYWRSRADAARTRVADAQTRLDEANGQVSRMMRRNHPRGEARQARRAEQQAARDALESATHHLEVELPEEARAAGAQQAWLRASTEPGARGPSPQGRQVRP
jgi:hypothetical protein